MRTRLLRASHGCMLLRNAARPSAAAPKLDERSRALRLLQDARPEAVEEKPLRVPRPARTRP